MPGVGVVSRTAEDDENGANDLEDEIIINGRTRHDDFNAELVTPFRGDLRIPKIKAMNEAEVKINPGEKADPNPGEIEIDGSADQAKEILDFLRYQLQIYFSDLNTAENVSTVTTENNGENNKRAKEEEKVVNDPQPKRIKHDIIPLSDLSRPPPDSPSSF